MTIPSSPLPTGEEIAWRGKLLSGHIENPRAYASFVLGKVSRTFALNIQILTAPLRRQVLLAYLFCRMADTLEDDTGLPPGEKAALLHEFAELFSESNDNDSRLRNFLQSLPPEWKNSDEWDHLLLYHSQWIFGEYRLVKPEARAIIARCVKEMSGGMAEFSGRQGSAFPEGTLIDSMEDLDRYCYYVAGTVGIMLGELFALHTPLIGSRRLGKLKKFSVSFGLGLQLTNILKDIQADRERNVSFIPGSLLREKNLSTSLLHLPENRREAESVSHVLIGKAKRHLEDALEYTCLLPRLEPRLRLFCLWPLFMAVETLVLAAENRNAVKPAVEIKIRRRQVRNIIRITSLSCWSDFLIRRLFRRRLRRLEAALSAFSMA